MVDQEKRKKLLQLITAQPEHEDGQALVKVAEFFNGNDDLGSIGCNLVDYPGLDKFRQVIEKLLMLPTVDQVWLQIYDFEEGNWPFSENILIFGDVTAAEIEQHASEIGPCEVQEMQVEWSPSRAPELEGRRYINIWWD